MDDDADGEGVGCVAFVLLALLMRSLPGLRPGLVSVLVDTSASAVGTGDLLLLSSSPSLMPSPSLCRSILHMSGVISLNT